jgi:hypothetical protein
MTEENQAFYGPILKEGQKRIATIHLIYDDGKQTNEVSRLTPNPHGKGEFAIIMVPSNDVQQIDSLLGDRVSENKGQLFATVIAHEMGHAIANAVNTPSHNYIIQELIGTLPREVEAWKLAGEIYPKLDYNIASSALATYEGDETVKWQDAPASVRSLREGIKNSMIAKITGKRDTLTS